MTGPVRLRVGELGVGPKKPASGAQASIWGRCEQTEQVLGFPESPLPSPAVGPGESSVPSDWLQGGSVPYLRLTPSPGDTDITAGSCSRCQEGMLAPGARAFCLCVCAHTRVCLCTCVST